MRKQSLQMNKLASVKTEANLISVEKILNCILLMEKHIYQHRPLCHNFIDFKKAFDRVLHAGLWHTMTTYGIIKELIDMIS